MSSLSLISKVLIRSLILFIIFASCDELKNLNPNTNDPDLLANYIMLPDLIASHEGGLPSTTERVTAPMIRKGTGTAYTENGDENIIEVQLESKAKVKGVYLQVEGASRYWDVAIAQIGKKVSFQFVLLPSVYNIEDLTFEIKVYNEQGEVSDLEIFSIDFPLQVDSEACYYRTRVMRMNVNGNSFCATDFDLKINSFSSDVFSSLTLFGGSTLSNPFGDSYTLTLYIEPDSLQNGDVVPFSSKTAQISIGEGIARYISLGEGGVTKLALDNLGEGGIVFEEIDHGESYFQGSFNGRMVNPDTGDFYEITDGFFEIEF